MVPLNEEESAMSDFFDSISAKIDQMQVPAPAPQQPQTGPLRSSLEILQRMANGIDPFDHNRFRCAVAALPHETPKLSANVSSVSVRHAGPMASIRAIEEARERMKAAGMTVIEGGRNE